MTWDVTDTALPILIVEDDEPTVQLLQAILRRAGHATETTANGRDAIALLQQKRYSAIVLDMMMPEVGGREVVDFVRTLEVRTPVIVCSAAGPRALEGLDDAVVKAVIRKPFDVEQFMSTIRSLASKA
jgi:CheY-like chemotaxis protein